MENLSLHDVSNLPEHRAAVLWMKAQEALSLYPEGDLLRHTDGESHYVMTPAYTHAFYPTASKDRRSTDFSIAALVESPAAKKIPNASPTYLIIDGNIHRPLVQFDRFNPDAPVTLLHDDGGTIEDDNITAIVDGIANEARLAKHDYDRKQEQDKQKSRTRRRTVAGVAAVALVGVGVLQGVTYWIDRSNENERQAIEQFDGQDIELSGELTGPGEVSYAASDIRFFDRHDIPDFDEELVRGPRDFNLNTGECVDLGIIAENEEVSVVTAGPADSVIVAVNSAGYVQVCSFDSVRGEANDDSSTEYAVAAQIR